MKCMKGGWEQDVSPAPLMSVCSSPGANIAVQAGEMTCDSPALNAAVRLA